MRKKYIYALVPIIIATLALFYVGYTSVLNNDVELRIVQSNQKIGSFNAKNLDGSKANVEATDRVHVYEVFASWCIPCKKSVPSVLEFAKKTNTGVTGIAYRDVNFEIEKFQKEYGTFNNVIMANGSVENAFSVRSVPQTLFTKNGKILYRVYGEASSQDLEKVLALIEAKKPSS